MKTIHDYKKRLERTGEALDKSRISEADKILIRKFTDQKAAKGVGEQRQEKYLRILREIAERYFEQDSQFSLTKEETIQMIVAKIERSEFSEWTKYDFEFIRKTFLMWRGRERKSRG